MKILFITNTFPPNICGVGDYTFFLCRQFVQRGDKCVVVCRKDDCQRDAVEGISVCSVVEKWNKSASKIVLGVIENEKPDIVSLQYVPHGFDAKGLPFGIIPIVRNIHKTGIPIFTFIHEPFVMINDCNPKHLFVALCERFITGYVIKKSARVATSILNYKNRLSWYDDSIRLIPIPSNIPLLTADDEKKNSLRHGIDADGKLVVALFGVRDKNSILKAFSNIFERRKDIKLLILGKSDWNGFQPDWVYRTGKLSAEKLAEYFNIVDIFVLPEKVSRRMKRGGVCLKSGSLAAAIQYRLPILTACGDHTDQVLKDKLMFADFSNADDVEQKLTTLLNDSSLREKMSSGYGDLLNELTWEHTYQEYKNIINEIL